MRDTTPQTRFGPMGGILLLQHVAKILGFKPSIKVALKYIIVENV